MNSAYGSCRWAVLSNAIHDVGDLKSRVVAFPDETQFQKGQHHLRR